MNLFTIQRMVKLHWGLENLWTTEKFLSWLHLCIVCCATLFGGRGGGWSLREPGFCLRWLKHLSWLNLCIVCCVCCYALKGVLHLWTLFLKTLCIFSKNKATSDKVSHGSGQKCSKELENYSFTSVETIVVKLQWKMCENQYFPCFEP